MHDYSQLMRYFEFLHLPPKLQHVSRHFWTLSNTVLATLPDGPEKTACLRKLLESKDCAVRAALDIPDTTAA
jgi:ferritin-like protein